VKNSKCKKHGNKFAEPLKLFSLYIFIVGGRMLYELLHANLYIYKIYSHQLQQLIDA